MRSKRWFARHPVLALLVLNGALFLGALLIAEIGLRIFIPYNPGYYMAVEGTGSELVYPYGVIRMNSDGFADDEFDLSGTRRVGYFGDSVTYGTGAGHGYRVSELLEEAYPEYEHLNFGGIDLSASAVQIEYFASLAERYQLTDAFYLFNLNDILPEVAVHGTEKTTVSEGLGFVRRYLDWMRGKSFAYTYLRNAVKTALATSGTGWRGYPTYELFPEQHAAVLEQTAERVDGFRTAIEALGVNFTLIILPYEMQISEEAAQRYTELGVDWEDGFTEGSTQRILREHLPEDMRVFDAYEAFVDAEDPEGARARNPLGEFFVYDRGDKLDWNHPNREGHRLIAEYLVRGDILDHGEKGVAVQSADASGPERATP